MKTLNTWIRAYLILPLAVTHPHWPTCFHLSSISCSPGCSPISTTSFSPKKKQQARSGKRNVKLWEALGIVPLRRWYYLWSVPGSPTPAPSLLILCTVGVPKRQDWYLLKQILRRVDPFWSTSKIPAFTFTRSPATCAVSLAPCLCVSKLKFPRRVWHLLRGLLLNIALEGCSI